MNALPDLTGRAVLVTGATRGLGRHLAHELATLGAAVLLHGRDAVRLRETAAEILVRTPGAEVRTYCADLSDLDQVRRLAAEVRAVEPRLDVLVHNAVVGGGADTSRREVTAAGLELRLTVNHLAPLSLTRELADLLAASAPARVVAVASMGQAPIPLDDLQFTRDYEGVAAYCRSKLAMIMAAMELAAELSDRDVTVNALHPAHLMDTAVVAESGFTPLVSVEHGARPTLRLIADPALRAVTGRYFDRFDEARAHPQAYDARARAEIVRLSEELIAEAQTSEPNRSAGVSRDARSRPA